MTMEFEVGTSATEMSQLDFLLVQSIGIATPVLVGLSLLMLMGFTLLLVLKTRQPGRFLILAGLVLLISFGLLQSLRFFAGADVGEGLLNAVLARFIPVFAGFFLVLGYSRLVWSLYKSQRT